MKIEDIIYDFKVKEEEILTLVILLSQLIEDYQYNQEPNHKKKRNKIELKYYVKDNNFIGIVDFSAIPIFLSRFKDPQTIVYILQHTFIPPFWPLKIKPDPTRPD